MEATRFLGFILLALIAGGVLALFLELLNTERLELRRERALAAERGKMNQPALALPGFFAAPLRVTDTALPSSRLDDALLAILQDHVKAEQAVVAEFVHFPSLESLYRQAQPSLTLN